MGSVLQGGGVEFRCGARPVVGEALDQRFSSGSRGSWNLTPGVGAHTRPVEDPAEGRTTSTETVAEVPQNAGAGRDSKIWAGSEGGHQLEHVWKSSVRPNWRGGGPHILQREVRD